MLCVFYEKKRCMSSDITLAVTLSTPEGAGLLSCVIECYTQV